MILQLIRIIVEDAGFETGTDESAVWRNTIEPKLHYQLAATNAKFFCLYFISVYFISPVTVVEFLSKLPLEKKVFTSPISAPFSANYQSSPPTPQYSGEPQKQKCSVSNCVRIINQAHPFSEGVHFPC